MFMPSTLLFTLILFVSVFIVVSTPSWLGAWVGLEVNLMSFIPLMVSRGVMPSVESCIKYFLVQAFSSLLMLMSILLNMSRVGFMWHDMTPAVVILGVALLIKLGAAPFHYWFPAVSSGVGWFQNFILMTVQKIGPLVMLNYIWGMLPLSVLVVAASTIVGSIGGLNQSSLRKLMAYSSINHLGWLLVSCNFGMKFMALYFFIYMMTNLMLVYMLAYSGMFYLSQVYHYGGSGLLGMVIMVTWFSFGGLPPFVGFLGKWMVINIMVDSEMHGLCFVMILMSLVSLFYYTRVCYVLVSQSASIPLVRGTLNSNSWWVYLNMALLLMSLIGAPMFVVML